MLQRYFLAPLAALLLLAAAPRLTLAQTTPTGGVTIGAATAPDASAALDIVSSSKGLLLPRLASVTSITSPAPGLLVYQTGGTPGFYYNSGTAATPTWLRLSPGDNLGNHTATQDLNLNGQKLTGGGTNGLRVGTDGSVAVEALAGTGQGRLLTVAPDGTLQASAPIQNQALGNTFPDPVLLNSAATGTAPYGVVVAGTRAYVVNLTANTLQAFDVSGSGAPVLLGTVATDASPVRVALNGDGTRAYVVNQNSNSLQAFDVSGSGAPVLLGTVATGNAPLSVVVNRAGTRAYVVNSNSNTLQAYDVSGSGAPVSLGTVATGTTPYSVALNGVGTRAYVVNYDSNTLQAYDVSGSGTPVPVGSTVATGTFPNAVTVNAAGTRAYVINFTSRTLQTYDLSGGTPVVLGNAVSTGSNPFGLVVNTAGTRLYVTNRNSRTLQTYDLSGGIPVVLGNAVNTGGAPAGVALNGAGTRAYLANSGGVNMLQVYSLGATPTVVGITSDGSLGTLTLPQLADNLGNHTATQNLNLAGYQLVSGGSTGLALTSAGNVGIGTTAPTSTFQVNGSVAASIRTLPLTNDRLTDTDYTVIVAGSASLPAPGPANVGRLYHIINGNTNSNPVTGTFRDAGTTGTFSNITLNGNTGSKGITVQSDGTQWWIIGRE